MLKKGGVNFLFQKTLSIFGTNRHYRGGPSEFSKNAVSHDGVLYSKYDPPWWHKGVLKNRFRSENSQEGEEFVL